MNYNQAKQRVMIYRVIGLLIAAPSLISTVVSFLKMIYVRIESDNIFTSAIAAPIRELIAFIYRHTSFLSYFWNASPTPDHMNLSEPQNFPFISIYFLIFVGATFCAMGSKMSKRLDRIKSMIEDQVIAESIKGSFARTREEIANSVEIPKSGLLSELHKFYIAPIVAAVVGAIIVKLLGY
ncbi:YniB family protein [Pseudoalteromonas sp. OOF1S-7]|uniref:YniB family protein n=1 Tax=Pseudoalteromonas sp. OOF1S-7 TaxID=2917757 RepID=UPI001EF5196F|nr:YniB family protein [Pseudoalteromonas sp. OOF1S-7]MCG7536838.1 YniB family protein [Pseudoalteromonas sp. OOF1S-7]